MVAYVYTYKQSYRQGRPNWAWVRRCKWMFLRYEDSERFRHILSVLERWNIPMVPVGRENRIRGYIVLKIEDVREFLSMVAGDLLHDVYISEQRVRSLEDNNWDVEEVKVSPLFYVVWQLGISHKVNSRLSDVREHYKSMMKEVKKGVANGS